MAIPVSGVTAAGGGNLIPNPLVDVILQKSLNATDTLKFVDTAAVDGRQETYVIDNNSVDADFVDEEGRIPLAGLSWTQKTLNVKDAGVITVFSKQVIQDAIKNPMALGQPKVFKAFASLFESHLIGMKNGAPITSKFDDDIYTTHNATDVEVTALTTDGIRRAVSAAMGLLEEAGYDDEDNYVVILATDAKQILRDARSSNDTTAELGDQLYGLKRGFSQHLDKLGAAAAIGSMVGFVFDQSAIYLRVRQDIEVDFEKSASLLKADGTTRVDLWQQKLVAARFDARVGALIADERAVVRLMNAAA